MKYLILVAAFTLSGLLAYAQSKADTKIEYSLPPGFDNTISAKDYKTIVDLSVAILSKHYKIDHVEQGTVSVINDKNTAAVNLDNLVKKCIDETDHSKWQAIINDHFASLFNSIEAEKGIDPTNFDKVKNYLSVRIYPDETIAQRGGLDNFISRTDLEGTKTLLMLDLPQAFTPLQKKYFDLWHKSADDVFKAAILNVSKQKMEMLTKSFDISGTQVEFNFLENEDYGASYILDLSGNAPALVGEWGSVVAVPNKGLVAICKISHNKPVEFVKFIQRIKPLIEQSYNQGQGPVSKEFFWYYKGKFTHIVVNTDTAGNINVVAPLGLSVLMTEKK